MPAGVACAAMLGVVAVAGLDTTVGLLAPGFRVIAALTLPHMIVTALLDQDTGLPACPGTTGKPGMSTSS